MSCKTNRMTRDLNSLHVGLHVFGAVFGVAVPDVQVSEDKVRAILRADEGDLW